MAASPNTEPLGQIADQFDAVPHGGSDDSKEHLLPAKPAAERIAHLLH